jgi:ketosteroid isomerase-like protein
LQDEINRIQEVYAAFNRADFEAVVREFDEETEFIAPAEMPEQRTFRGREGYKEFLASILDVFEEFRSEPTRILEAGGGRYLVFLEERFRRKGDTAVVVEHPFALITMSAGRVRRLEIIADRREALSAAGLSEQDVRARS